MKAIRIYFWADSGFRLRVNYLDMIQGVLYHAWEKYYPDLHDKGYPDPEDPNGKRGIHPFTFSWIQGKNKQKDDWIYFFGNRMLSLEVRSQIPELLEKLADHLLLQRVIRLGQTVLPIIRIETADQLLFPSRALIQTVTPISVYSPGNNEKTHYYAPWEDDFPILLIKRLAVKIRALNRDTFPAMGCLPLEDTLKKRRTNFKGTWINGYSGKFILETDPENMELLYYTGLGACNSAGFGMFTIEQIIPD